MYTYWVHREIFRCGERWSTIEREHRVRALPLFPQRTTGEQGKRVMWGGGWVEGGRLLSQDTKDLDDMLHLPWYEPEGKQYGGTDCELRMREQSLQRVTSLRSLFFFYLFFGRGVCRTPGITPV